ncbi:MAG: hypothetical protein ABI601_06100 [bacterium]
MSNLIPPRRAGIVFMLVGLVFLFMGIRRHQSGGSAAFIALGFVAILIGVQRIRASTTPAP